MTIREISSGAHLCRSKLHIHLKILEQDGLITVDRSERPHSYEVTERGWSIHSYQFGWTKIPTARRH